MSEKEKKELNAEELDQVSGGAIETRDKGFIVKHKEYRASVGSLKGEWTRDLNKANDEENEFIAKGLK